MKRIIIDTEDANDPAAEDTPFTLQVFSDDEDGTQSRIPLDVGTETALIGSHVSDMLADLARVWSTGGVTAQDGDSLPDTYTKGATA